MVMAVEILRPRRLPHHQNLIDVIAEYKRPRIAFYPAAADRGPQQHPLVIVIIPLGRVVRIELLNPPPECIISLTGKKRNSRQIPSFIASLL
ncbi:MAG: hypothetical protein WHS88_08295 [Anaerohalosphaeraceae bacterium]